MAAPLLVLENICKTYPSGTEGGLPVLKNIRMRLEAGRSAAIVGPSGSGKTTLLNIIGTLDSPTAGRVLFRERDVAGLDEERKAELRNRKIGFVFQRHHLLPHCSALENVLVPSLVHPERKNAERRARALLVEVGLADRLDHRPARLSGGECQRVAVVRAMINSPDLLLADEPTGALDKTGSGKLADLLAEMNRRHGMAMIVVTHSPAVAERMDAVFELSDGGLVCRK